MPATEFDRDVQARWYARQHLNTDPGVCSIYYLPKHAPDREIRLVEVNHLIAERTDESLEPLNFGVDRGMESAHKLFVLDVTPPQWDRIVGGSLALPDGWSREDAVEFTSKKR